MNITETKLYINITYKGGKYIRIEHTVPDKFTIIRWGYFFDINKQPDIYEKLEIVYQSFIKQNTDEKTDRINS